MAMNRLRDVTSSAASIFLNLGLNSIARVPQMLRSRDRAEDGHILVHDTRIPRDIRRLEELVHAGREDEAARLRLALDTATLEHLLFLADRVEPFYHPAFFEWMQEQAAHLLLRTGKLTGRAGKVTAAAITGGIILAANLLVLETLDARLLLGVIASASVTLNICTRLSTYHDILIRKLNRHETDRDNRKWHRFLNELHPQSMVAACESLTAFEGERPRYPHSPLLLLPPELRQMVYENVAPEFMERTCDARAGSRPR